MPVIRWNRNCHICHCPLDLRIYCNSKNDIKVFNKFVDLSALYDNDSRYKFFGLKAHKVCISCYSNSKLHKNYDFIRSKEINGKFPTCRRSMTQEEVKEWFLDCKKYYRCIE